jgi:hypothetical protein
MQSLRCSLLCLSICLAALLPLSFPNAAVADRSSCAVANGDFDQNELFWSNEDSGPGVASAVEEIIDIDGRTNVLHLDSRAGSNYYLFRSQYIDLTDCGIRDRTIAWDWKLATIESAYGLAGVYLELFDYNGIRLAMVAVRRHTGQFGPYECTSVVDEHVQLYPDEGFLCFQQTNSTFGWEQSSISFTQDLADAMYGTPVDLDQVAVLKIRLQSYNNAGAGVDACFDDIHLVPLPTSVASRSWGGIKARYR